MIFLCECSNFDSNLDVSYVKRCDLVGEKLEKAHEHFFHERLSHLCKRSDVLLSSSIRLIIRRNIFVNVI